MQSTASAQRLFAPRHRSGALLDIAITGIAVGGSLLFLSHGGAGALRTGSRLDVPGGLLVGCAALPLLAWRRAPFGVFVVLAAASILTAGLGYSLSVPLAATVALYLLAASGDDANPWTLAATVIVAGLLAVYLAATAAANGAFPGLEVLHSGLAWAVAWFAGERTRLRRAHIAELEQRAVRAEREAERERRLAVIEERTRIARDLHDSAGHAINVIAVRAGAARMRHREDPDRSLDALETIEEVARETVDDIDQIVHTLRDDASVDGAPTTPPGLASLGTLVADHSHTGLRVTVRTAGNPRPLVHAADQAAYRILQEALTNAARHGTDAAEIDMSYSDASLALMITNIVPPAGGIRSAGGHGLIGMRERAALLGGSLRTERVNDAFRVCARLPYASHRA
ncbi:MAG: sensor histidine kinase [Solirubrobacteraceae bacterium]